MSIEVITLVMFGALVALLALGLPVAFAAGGLAVVFIYFLWGPGALPIIAYRIFGQMYQYLLFAIPLFIFSANMLYRSGVVEDLFRAILEWLGWLRGALASASVLAGTILAAIMGIIGAAVVTLGIIALPTMLEHKYDKKLAIGSIMAGGTLGILIPPSILFIIYGLVAAESIGALFAGGILPGLVLATLYITYITIRCYRNRKLGPGLSREEWAKITWKIRFSHLGGIAFPIILVVAVLGSIFTGVASITEAAGVAAFGGIVAAVIKRRLTWQNLKLASFDSAKTTCMVLWTIFGASAFVTFYLAVGGGTFITSLILGFELGKYGTLAIMMGILIILGMFLDWVGILYLCVPIFLPIVKMLGFDLLWFGIIYNVNMQISFLSPPFGYALFYIKGVAPPEVTMADIYRSALPFLGLQFIGLVICIAFPIIPLLIPSLLFPH